MNLNLMIYFLYDIKNGRDIVMLKLVINNRTVLLKQRGYQEVILE